MKPIRLEAVPFFAEWSGTRWVGKNADIVRCFSERVPDAIYSSDGFCTLPWPKRMMVAPPSGCTAMTCERADSTCEGFDAESDLVVFAGEVGSDRQPSRDAAGRVYVPPGCGFMLTEVTRGAIVSGVLWRERG